MSTELAPVNTGLSHSNDVLSIVGEMDKLLYLGTTLVKSGLLPPHIKTPEGAVAIILTGRELGIGPMVAFNNINVIQGKPTVSPQLMIALAQQSGQLQNYKIEDDGNKCTVSVLRRGHSPFSASFSMEDAKNMGIDGKDNWKKQPKIMRQWRAISAAFRVKFADVLAGIFTLEVDEEGEIIAETSPLVETKEDEQRPEEETLEDIIPDKETPFWCETEEGQAFRKEVNILMDEIQNICETIRKAKHGDEDTQEAQAEIKSYLDNLYQGILAIFDVENASDPGLNQRKATGISDRLTSKRDELQDQLRMEVDDETLDH